MMTLVDELVLFLINSESGYFHQVPGWNLNCAVTGAAIAELSLASRIDTDLETLFLTDPTETGDPVLDPILRKIQKEPKQQNAQYWIERLTPDVGPIIDATLERLVERGILDHHDGGFWSVRRDTWQSESYSSHSDGDSKLEFVKTRLGKVIFDNEIPDPRDILLISLVNTCDVFQHIFPIDEAAQKRIDAICNVDVVGRAISEAISKSLAGPMLQRPVRSKPIPSVPMRDLLFNPHARNGNLSALFADLAKKHGPVFRIKPAFVKEGMIFLTGVRANRWLHRDGRNFLRAADYLDGFRKVYGAARILPSLDGADHFRLRKAYGSIYARSSLENRLDELFRHARGYLAGWKTGDTLPALATFCQLMNAQFSPLTIGIDTQDCIDELLGFKARALTVYVMKALPEFMMNTPGMKRKKKHIAKLAERVQAAHTPAQRAGCPRNLADELLGLHTNDPQFLPETDLPFAFVSPLLASFYLGSAMSFAVYAMVSQPSLHDRIQAEADAFFADGEPEPGECPSSRMGVTHRLIMETLRMYPIVPGQRRTVMNACVVEGHELPTGSQVFLASTATHYMEDVFPKPFSFDIDRYLPERQENTGFGYAPFGFGTHTCLGSRWLELQLGVNLLLIARYFKLALPPKQRKLPLNPIPSLAPGKKLKFVIAEQRRDMPAG